MLRAELSLYNLKVTRKRLVRVNIYYAVYFKSSFGSDVWSSYSNFDDYCTFLSGTFFWSQFKAFFVWPLSQYPHLTVAKMIDFLGVYVAFVSIDTLSAED